MRGFSRVNLARDHTGYNAKLYTDCFFRSKCCLEIWLLLFPLQTKVISFGKALKQLLQFMRNTSNFSTYNCIFFKRGKEELG